MINDKKYIGITCRKPERRFGNNGNNYKDAPLFWNAIQKYGWNKFKHEILFEGLTKEAACKKEIELIQEYCTTDPDYGYNIHPGGGIPPIMRGKENPFYNDHRFAGENHPMFGKKHSAEAKEKMSKNHANVKGSKNPFYGDHRFAEGNHPNAKPVICVETGIKYCTITDAEQMTSIARQSIRKAISGRLHTAGGFHWIDADN